MTKPLEIPKLTFVRGSELKVLTVLTVWKSTGAILLEWLIMAFCIWIHMTYNNPIIYFLVWFVISTRLYSLYSLIHDAIHYLIVRNKLANDIVSQIMLGFPLLLSLKRMRKAHLDHHKYLQTDKDPEIKHLEYKEFQYPKTKQQLFQLYFYDITGINFLYYQFLRLKHLFQVRTFKSGFKKDKLLLNGFYLVLFIASLFFGFSKELIIYWLIPYATLYQLLNRIRLSTEHFNIAEDSLLKTRSVIPSVWEQMVLTPYNLGYHLDHHLYPGVPFYNLPKLHELLLQHTEYSKYAIIDTSYKNVLKNCI